MFSSTARRLLHVSLALSLPALSLAGCGGANLSSAVSALPPGTINTDSISGAAAPAEDDPDAPPTPAEADRSSAEADAAGSATPASDTATAGGAAVAQVPAASGGSGGGSVSAPAPSFGGGSSSGGSAPSAPSAPAPAPAAATAGSDAAPLPAAPVAPVDDTPTVTSEALPPNTTPITNIAGMNASNYVPTVRSTFFDVSPDGRRVAIAWLHNKPKADGTFDTSGEPITYATVGDPAVPSSFKAPQVIGQRMFDVLAGYDSRKVYNLAHNAPYVVADRKGGFIGLSVPMNANGYAEGMPATTMGYGLSTLAAGANTWSAQGKALLTHQPDGSSLSEMSGNMDPAGNANVFGQGHLGFFQSGFGYQRLKAGGTTWDSKALGSAYRTSSVNFFCEGGGYASQVKNKQGCYDLHAAFGWNKAGITPIYGLSYVVSHDGGDTWQTAAGSALTLPVKATDSGAAVFAANLNASTGTGSVPGHSVINVGAADDGTPMILRPNFTDSTRQAVQHHLYAYAGGKWVDVPVGPALYWNAAGNGVAYNGLTGMVNVVLLDPGSYAKPARILLESESLADLKAGKANWKEEVICQVKQIHYASSLKVKEVKNTKFVCLFDGEYHNPGTVQPVLVEAPMR